MNMLRNALFGGIFLVVFLLFVRWNEFQESKIASPGPEASSTVESVASSANPPSDIPTATSTTTEESDLPVAPSEEVSGSTNTAPVETAPQISQQIITVKTDTLDVEIDPQGGDIVKVALPKHLADIDDPKSEFTLLTRNRSHTYIAESDLIGTNGTHTQKGRVTYQASASQYTLNDGQDTLVVDLTTKQDSTFITKRFTFNRDSYLINVEYLIDNTQSTNVWKAALYGRIKRDDYVPRAGGKFQMSPFLGAATTNEDTNYEKYKFDDIEKESIEFDYKGGWVAMVQHYFVSAWIPDPETKNQFTLKQSSNRQYYYLGFKTPLNVVQPGAKHSIKASFYAGPKILENLEKVSPHLDLTIDFGILWFVAKPLFLGLDFIHGLIGNWGFSIILLTFFIKLIFFYPSAMSYRSMAKMRKLMPKMQELKERFGDDRQKMGMETMKLYKKEGVNPLGGCLPMLMQMPVFMALYWMIMETVELRHSPFVFWIVDLSVKDPMFVLPIIMGALMFVQQKLNPPPQDPMQAKIFQFMPIGFTFILMFLPAALTLYMAVNSALSFMQQYVITKQIEKASD